jgi:hypothetical protein
MEDMIKQLELQLHQQYAENSNSTLGSVLSLFIAMLAVLAGYGYVYINSCNVYSEKFEMVGRCNDLYTLNAVIVAGAAAILVLTAIAFLCIETGYKRRMEQFIAFAIRCKYYSSKGCESNSESNSNEPNSGTTKEYQMVFPKGYHPFDKGWLKAIQGPYDTFGLISMFVVLVIIASICLKVSANSTCFCDWECRDKCIVAIPLICLIVIPIKVICLYGKYKDRQLEFLGIERDSRKCCCKSFLEREFSKDLESKTPKTYIRDFLVSVNELLFLKRESTQDKGDERSGG